MSSSKKKPALKESCGRLSCGQSLIEVIVAVTVGILIVSALVFATIFSLRNASFASNSAQATKLAQEGIEKLRTLRDRDGSVSYSIPPDFQAEKFSDLFPAAPINFSCSAPANCYFYFHGGTLAGRIGASFEEIPPRFQRQVIIEGGEANQKQFTVIVKWRGFANEHESRLTTILRKL